MVCHDVYNLHLPGWRKMKVEPGANEVLRISQRP